MGQTSQPALSCLNGRATPRPIPGTSTAHLPSPKPKWPVLGATVVGTGVNCAEVGGRLNVDYCDRPSQPALSSLETAPRLSYNEGASFLARGTGMTENAAAGHVLVVDDDRDFCRFIVELLRAAAFHVRAAPDGRNALVSARVFRPALVLLDVNLPHISGYEVFRGLRRELGNEISLFLLSGARTEAYDR